RESVDALAHESDRAGLGGERAGDQVEERRLAGAVGTDESGDGARLDGEIDAVDGAQIAECLDEPRHLQHGARLAPTAVGADSARPFSRQRIDQARTTGAPRNRFVATTVRRMKAASTSSCATTKGGSVC